MLDIPPHIEHAIIAKAKQQGISTNELLEQLLLASDIDEVANELTQIIPLTDDDKAMIQDLLDNPPPPTPKMLELFNMHKDFGKAY